MQHLYTHDYGNGLKLMEHSYIGNNMMNVIDRLLLPDGLWYKQAIVWAGDYADEDEDGTTLYSKLEDDKKIMPKTIPEEAIPEEYKYLVNHDKKVFVDMSKVKPDGYNLRIHPLPLLTAEGCGRGGGDFHGEDSRIGTWARNRISIEKDKPENFEEVDGQFVES